MKHSKLKVKRNKLKKISKAGLRRLQMRADRALQDYMRDKYKYQSCEACLNPFQVSHHAFTKSSCFRLRYEEINLVKLCHSCHTKHHLQGNPTIMATVLLKRGQNWWDALVRLSKEKPQEPSEKYYLDIINKYKI